MSVAPDLVTGDAPEERDAEAGALSLSAQGLDLLQGGLAVPANDDAPKPDEWVDKARALLAKHSRTASPTGRAQRPLRDFAAYRAEMTTRPRPEWMFDGVANRGGIVTILGQPKACKSWLSMDAVVSVATGVPLCGFITTHRYGGKALIFNTENSPKGLEQRIVALAEAKREDFVPAEGSTIEEFDRMLNANLYVMERQSMNLLDDVGLVALLSEILAVVSEGLDLVVLDPFRDLFDVEDEKDNTQMGRAMDRLRVLRACLEEVMGQPVTIMVVHHAKKTQGQREMDVRQMARGGSSFVGKVDGLIGMGNPRGPDKAHLVQDMFVIPREGRGIEGKTLTMRVEDDANGWARKAWWEVEDFNPESRGRASTEGRQQEITKRAHAWLLQQSGYSSKEKVRVALNCGAMAARRALEQLAAEGKATRGPFGGYAAVQANGAGGVGGGASTHASKTAGDDAENN